MKKILLFSFISLTFTAFSQPTNREKVPVFSKENAFIGGSGTFTFGGGNGAGLLLGLNPMYGYYIKEWLDVALPLNLQYNSFELDANAILNGRQKRSFVLGSGLSSRIYPVDFLFLQVQPEMNIIFSKETPVSFLGGTGATLRYTNLVPSLLVGGGMKRGFQKGRTFAYASILFDIAGNAKSPYRALSIIGSTGNVLPIFRAGLNFSLADIGKNRNN